MKIEALMLVALIVINRRLCMGFVMEMGCKTVMWMNKMFCRWR